MGSSEASSSNSLNARRKEVWTCEMDKTPQAKSQKDKFREAARKLETDDDEKRFDERLGKIAKASPPKDGKSEEAKPAK